MGSNGSRRRRRPSDFRLPPSARFKPATLHLRRTSSQTPRPFSSGAPPARWASPPSRASRTPSPTSPPPRYCSASSSAAASLPAVDPTSGSHATADLERRPPRRHQNPQRPQCSFCLRQGLAVFSAPHVSFLFSAFCLSLSNPNPLQTTTSFVTRGDSFCHPPCRRMVGHKVGNPPHQTKGNEWKMQ